VSDGTRTRGRRDHNPSKGVLQRRAAAKERGFSVAEVASVALTLDPALSSLTRSSQLLLRVRGAHATDTRCGCARRSATLSNARRSSSSTPGDPQLRPAGIADLRAAPPAQLRPESGAAARTRGREGRRGSRHVARERHGAGARGRVRHSARLAANGMSEPAPSRPATTGRTSSPPPPPVVLILNRRRLPLAAAATFEGCPYLVLGAEPQKIPGCDCGIRRTSTGGSGAMSARTRRGGRRGTSSTRGRTSL